MGKQGVRVRMVVLVLSFTAQRKLAVAADEELSA
jgi:hypothetical protein